MSDTKEKNLLALSKLRKLLHRAGNTADAELIAEQMRKIAGSGTQGVVVKGIASEMRMGKV